MTDSFVDQYLPDEVQGIPCQVGPRFSTRIVVSKAGTEARNQNWQAPLRKFTLPEAVSDQTAYEAALGFWLVMGGPYSTWPFRDPLDFASVGLEGPNVEPDTTGLDQSLAIGDGVTYQFQLVKTYAVGMLAYTRTIYLPVLDSIAILIDGEEPGLVSVGHGGPYTVESITRPGGVVTIHPAPTTGRVLTWGGLFDTEVRWDADDSFDGVMHSDETAGATPITLVEVRRC